MPTPRPDPQEARDATERALDLLLGAPGGGAPVDADPALAAELRSLRSLFEAVEHAYVAGDAADADARAAERVAARVRDQVAGEERARRREALRPRASRRRLVWIRLLAGSLAIHAAVIAVLVLRSPGHDPAPQGPDFLAHLVGPREALAPEEDLPAFDPPRIARGRLEDPIVPDLPVTRDAGAPAEALSLPELRDRVREFPEGLGIEMLARTDESFKRRRLAHLELDPDGTLKRVRRGLEALAHMQEPDGSFVPAVGGSSSRSTVATTALALLPFLGDGRGSRSPSAVEAGLASEATARGIAWLRTEVFPGPSPATPEADVEGLGLALTALSEDYMVSYGRLSPGEADQRARELRDLVARIAATQLPDGSFPGRTTSASGRDDLSSGSLWAMWGLDAAARTGAAVPPAAAAERFARWYAGRMRTEDGVPRHADGTPDRVLAAAALLFSRDLGSAFAPAADHQARWVAGAGLPTDDGALYLAAVTSGLLRHDPTTFRAWNRESGSAIAARLDPRGVARPSPGRPEDPVGDTALVLLALQAAYRTY
jgi:hypothetical protein